jgi:streptomycin 6-kinase
MPEASLKHYAHQWGLSDPTHLASTHTSHVYRVKRAGEPCVLKILTAEGVEYEGQSYKHLKYFNGEGAVRLLGADAGALLLEDLGANNLSSVVETEGDERACHILCDLLDILHSKKPKSLPEGIHDLSGQFKSLFNRVEKGGAEPFFIRGAKIARELIETEGPKVLLHGDIHHLNILKSPTRGWLVIDPQAFYAERTYDVANMFFNPNMHPDLIESPDRIKKVAEIFSNRLGVDKNRVLKFAYVHGALSVSWQYDDNEDAPQRKRILAMIEGLL